MKKVLLVLLSSILTLNCTFISVGAEGVPTEEPETAEGIVQESEEQEPDGEVETETVGSAETDSGEDETEPDALNEDVTQDETAIEEISETVTEETAAAPSEEITEEDTTEEEIPEETEPAQPELPSEENNTEPEEAEDLGYYFGISGDTAPAVTDSDDLSSYEGYVYAEPEIFEEDELPSESLAAGAGNLSVKERVIQQYQIAKLAVQNAEKAVSKAESDVANAAARNAAGIKGFFSWLSTNKQISEAARNDAAIAVMLLNNNPEAFKNANYIGHYAGGIPKSISELLQKTTDYNNLSYLRQNVLYIQECNDLRAIDNNFKGLKPLKVSSQLMAMAMLQLNWSSDYIGHSQYFSVGENLAWGYKDPFAGWYYEEKALYDNGQGGTGHYLNICRESYTATGFATVRQNAKHGIAHGQVFNNRARGDAGAMSVSEYLKLVDEYCPKENAEEILSAAKKELERAQLNLATREKMVNIVEGRKKYGFVEVDGKQYWFENGEQQGVYGDKKNVRDQKQNIERGREICDFDSQAWYWLDARYDGAKAVNKEVYMPYIFQDEKTMSAEKLEGFRELANNYTENPNGETALMGDQLVAAVHSKTGKWVRYDGEGKMYKGWLTINNGLEFIYPDQAGNTYYYDYLTGLMAKGWTRIGGKDYHFNELTGVLDS